MDLGFTNQRDSDAMTRDNYYNRENYLTEELSKVRRENMDLNISIRQAKILLTDVLNGCYCKEDIERFVKE